MKNIHVLPTENSSRLSYNENGVLKLNRLQWRKGTQNMYITSDEEIKDGDWRYDIELNRIEKGKETGTFKNWKKIILTTDQDLIKDGVQEIDNDFLEWFVKNPSCEEVEVEEDKHLFCKHCNTLHSTHGDGINCDVCRKESQPYLKTLNYKIIIPKEVPKQETLEEAAQRIFNGFGDITKPSAIKRALELVKWQQEQCKKDLDAHLDVAEDLWLQVVKQNKNLYSDKEVKHLMTLTFEQGFKKADVVEAGLEAKETDTEVNWIFLKHKK